jgi:opacity protein-like surface antigen
MNKIKLLAFTMIAVLPAVSQAQDVQTYFGAGYEHSNVKVGNHHTNVDGIQFQAASELEWGNIKGTAATLTGNGADLDNYTFSVEKPYSIKQSDLFVSPETGVTYARYKDHQLKESDIGLMVGASLGYNINKQFQLVSNYNHSFGLTSSHNNIDEDNLSVGVNYRFNA